MKAKRHWLGICFTALVIASLLLGCSGSGSKEHPAQSTATEAVTQDQAAAAKVEGGLVVVIAKVQAIDKKNRVVTLKFRNGKEGKVKCGHEVRNFAQMHVGDDVTTTLMETVELFVTSKEKTSAERAMEVDRAPLGNKPGFSIIDMVEVKAAVVAINYQTRYVTLKGSEGKVIKVKASPEVKRLNKVKKGDSKDSVNPSSPPKHVLKK